MFVPKIPRELNGSKLIKILMKIGYEETRSSSSHIRLSRKNLQELEHHITIPNHNPIKIGTLNSIINDLTDNLKIEKKELLKKLFG